MDDRVRERLDHIKDAIREIRSLLDEKTFDALRTEKVTRAAFERFLEIISEASRYIPDDWKTAYAPVLNGAALRTLEIRFATSISGSIFRSCGMSIRTISGRWRPPSMR